MRAKKYILPAGFCVLGIFIFFLTRNFPTIPTGLGPAFFPRLIAGVLISFSVLEIIFLLLKKEQEKEKTSDMIKVILVTVSLIVMTVLMEFVHPLVAVSVFFIGYIKYIAQQKWKNTVIISAIGTVIIFASVVLLRIPL